MTYPQIIEQAKQTQEIIMVLVEGDWYAVRWVSDAYDGSPYGTTGFADENNMLVAEDMITYARSPREGEHAYISSDAERHQERRNHEMQRREDALQEERRVRREATRSRRRELEERYRNVTGNDDGAQLSMTDMRSAINRANQHSASLMVETLFRGMGR